MSFQQEIDEAIKANKIYFVGERLPNDWYEAFNTWSDLANKGDVKALANVGWCLYSGTGVQAPDIPKAKVLLEEAVAKGDSFAAFTLHLLYQNAVKDEVEADRYLKLSVEMGSVRGIEKVKSLRDEAAKKIAAAKLAEQNKIAAEQKAIKVVESKKYFEDSFTKVDALFAEVKKIVEQGKKDQAIAMIKKFSLENPSLKFVDNYLPYLNLTVKFVDISAGLPRYEITNPSNLPVSVRILGTSPAKTDYLEMIREEIPPSSSNLCEGHRFNVAYTADHVVPYSINLLRSEEDREKFIGDYISGGARFEYKPPEIKLNYIDLKKRIFGTSSTSPGGAREPVDWNIGDLFIALMIVGTLFVAYSFNTTLGNVLAVISAIAFLNRAFKGPL